mgnify:CR=1 FL=1
MKKLLLLATALLTLNTVNADLLIHESFEKSSGDVCTATFDASTSNTTDWYIYSTGGSTTTQVVEGSLSYADYAVEKGAKIQVANTDKKIVRQFTPVTSGKVFCSAIINVDELTASTTWCGTHLLTFGSTAGSGTPAFARLYIRSVKDGDDLVGYQLAVSKNGETGTASNPSIVFSETLNTKTNYLIVFEYEFVSGDANDIVRLYVNPTKETTTTTLMSQQEVIAGDRNVGAGGKDDATSINLVYTRPLSSKYSGYTPAKVYLDEIKVATAWGNLFAGESGETPVEEPEITATPAILQFGAQVFVGSTYTTKFVVKGKNLNGDITLTSSNAELTLDKTTIAKTDAESENGVEVVATLKPTTETYAMETVTLASQDAKDVVLNTSWYAVAVVSCSTLAEAKKAAINASGFDDVYINYTGEAVVTYAVLEEIVDYSYNLKYLEDNTAAIRISDVYWKGVKQGDKITGFVLQAQDPKKNDVPIVTAFGADAIILSSENDVTPQVVTLANLKNNADDYLYELVKVEGVTFADNENWKSGAQIKQGENTAVVNLISGNELINTPKPAKADIIGISKSTTGTVLCVRGKQDVVAAPTAIENIAADSEVEIYTVSGMRVSELQPGVNIIRQGNKTFKVVR